MKVIPKHSIKIRSNEPKNKIRVLHFTKSAALYGAERVILNLVEHIKQDTFDVFLLILDDPKYSNRELIKEVNCRGGKTIELPCKGRLDFQSIRRLRHIVSEYEIDIIHSHEVKSRLYSLLAAKTLRQSIITTHHNWTQSSLKIIAIEFLDAALLRFFDHIIAVSESLYRTLSILKIPKKRISVIQNGINIQEFSSTSAQCAKLKQNLGFNDQELIIGTVGRLSKEKNQKCFIESASMLLRVYPALRFLIVGDGPLRAELEYFAESLGMTDNITFTGFREDIQGLLSIMDIFVLTSLREAMPMAVLEAMAVGLPVVAPRVGDISKIITSGENGMLLDSHDATLVFKTVSQILDDNAISTRLAKNAVTTIRERYSADMMTRQYEQVYIDLIRQPFKLKKDRKNISYNL